VAVQIVRSKLAAAVTNWLNSLSRRLVFALALLPAACQQPPAFLEPLLQPSGLQAAPPRVSSAIPSDHTSRTVFQDTGGTTPATNAAVSPASNPGQTGEVTLNFVDTDIREVARTILGATLKLNYTIDPNVHGTATFENGAPIARSALLPALETMLNQNGATLVQKDGLYAVVPISVAAGTNTAAGTVGTGTQVVALRFAVAKDLAKTLEPFVADGGKITADPGRNALIVSGDAAVRQTLIGLINSFDVDVLAGQSIALFPIGDDDLTKTAAALEKVLRAEADGPLAGAVRVIPLQRANAILVASTQARYLDAARRFFRLTNRAADATVRTWHVYYIKNGQSADLERLLQQAFTPGNITASAPGNTAPGGTPLSMGAGPMFETGAMGGPGRTSGTTQGNPGTMGLASLAGQTQAAAPAPNPPPGAAPLSTEASGAELQNQMRIIADRRNNALLVYATAGEYSVMEGMLRKIDIIPLQVLIEATIAEVTLNDALQYGTQFYLKNSDIKYTLGATPTLPTAFAGFAASVAPHVIIQALADVTQVKVLSAPRLLVMDNQPAHLQVGQEVPILTGTATSTLASGAPIVNSIDYHSTGVIMLVTPRVNSDGLVTLDLAQEVSDVAPPAANTATGSPTFNDRIVRTRLAVQDGQTIGVAGLIRDTVQEQNSGFPFLKDIPVISTLLSTQNNTRTRTELLVLITPHVVQDQRSARALTDDLRNQLFNAATVPQELQRKPPSGRHNPNGL
jgi:general secretion pathway protein D